MATLKLIQLKNFVKEYIDDEYSMQVLNYTLRRLVTNPALPDQSYYVRIEDGFLENPVGISVFKEFSRASRLIPILLSLRAISINPDFLDLCKSNELIFVKSPVGYNWRFIVPVIKKCSSDEDFSNLLSMLDSCCEKQTFSENQLDIFNKYAVAPFPKFKNKVLADEARKLSQKVGERVIGDNAFLGNEELVEYEISGGIQFVGNTAFAYCQNLKQISIIPRDLTFGTFPIIECPNLNKIIVPDGCLEYYSENLPYYKEIIVEYSQQIVSKSLETKEEAKTLQGQHVIDHDKLYHVFDKRVSSYKFFWLLSILSILERNDCLSISMEDLVIEMVSLSWPLMYKYDISLGSRDMMKNIGDRLIENATLSPNYETSVVRSILKSTYTGIKPIIGNLLKNVPYRFLSPWIKFTSNADVEAKSQGNEYATPYAIHDDYISLDEDWSEFFIENLSSIKSYISTELYSYLKSYNTELKLLKLRLESQEE